jgi:hypothetical protein
LGFRNSVLLYSHHNHQPSSLVIANVAVRGAAGEGAPVAGPGCPLEAVGRPVEGAPELGPGPGREPGVAGPGAVSPGPL